MKIEWKVILGCIFLASCNSLPSADEIFYNAKIYSVNTKFSVSNTLVIKDGKILALGGDSLLKKYACHKKTDLKNQYVYPGFIDAHCHFSGYALDKQKVDLKNCTSIQQIIVACQLHHSHYPSEWILGRQWDENKFIKNEVIHKDSLDKYFPNNPVFLLRIDGHAAWCNQKALDLAGIKVNQKLEGGIIQTENGKLTGLLMDKAVDLVSQKIPSINPSLATGFFKQTEKEFFKLGVTSFVDCMVDNDWMHWLQQAYKQGELQINGGFVLTNTSANKNEYLHQTPYQQKNISIIGFKIFADGSLGSRGAYMLEPYNDQHAHCGYLATATDSILSLAKALRNTPYQLLVHAIGDKANREVLQIYTQVLEKGNDRRWRIEHAQVVNPNDISVFRNYHIIPSVQPTHATSDQFWVKDRIGDKRLAHAYAYKTLLDQNNWLPLGTDFPVEDLNPLHTFCAAVFRINKELQPQGGFQIQEALSREDALRGMTIWAAQSFFQEKQKGSLEANKDADFVVLDIDLMHASAQDIYKAKILSTYYGGKCVYRINN